MKEASREKYWHELFEGSLILKGFNGIWETLSGAAFLLLSKATLGNWFFRLTRNELLEDQGDRVINFFSHILQNVSHSTQTFAALYILFHGLLNIFLVIQLYREKHWAFLVTISATVVFMTYQIHRIFLFHSTFLILLTIFDLFYIVLAWHEYKYHVLRAKKT